MCGEGGGGGGYGDAEMSKTFCYSKADKEARGPVRDGVQLSLNPVNLG